MKKWFESPSAPLSEAERALKGWGIKYKKLADGALLVPGSLDISDKGLTCLPDLSRVIVRGTFDCSKNRLVSLAGAPQDVGYGFRCYGNRLPSLAGIPAHCVQVISDFGNFSPAHPMPEYLRHPPETTARQQAQVKPPPPRGRPLSLTL